MTLTKHMLDDYLYQNRIRISEGRYNRILSLLGTEPDGAESWTDQNIYEQLRKLIKNV